MEQNQSSALMSALEKNVIKKIELLEKHPLKYIGRAIFAAVLLTFATAIAFLVSDHIQNFLLATIGSNGEHADVIYNVVKIIFSMIFPWALVMILFMHTELFTSNIMYFSAMLFRKKTTWDKTLKVWSACFLGNLIGGFGTAAILVFTKTLTGDNIGFAEHVVLAKMSKTALIILSQGIIANILVNVSVIISMNLKDDAAKLSAILFVIFIFAFFGSEHVIANFSSVGLVGFANGFQNLDLLTILHNFFFATIGNIIGGSIVGVLYSWLNKGNFIYKD